MVTDIIIQPIGIIHSCFTEKFGAPRQPGLVKSAPGRLELIEPYDRDEMVKGLEEFSHIWLQFLFHGTTEEGWKATVRHQDLEERNGWGSLQVEAHIDPIILACRLFALKA